MPGHGWRVAAVVGVLVLTSGSGAWAQPGRVLGDRSGGCDGCAERGGPSGCDVGTPGRPGVFKQLLGRLDASLQQVFPCDRCRCAATCEAPPGGAPCSACGCAEKSEAVFPPAPPALSPLLEDNPFRDDAPVPSRPRPAVRPRARTASAAVVPIPAVDASSTNGGEPRPLPRLPDAAPLRADQPGGLSELRPSERTAATLAAVPRLAASPAIHFVALDQAAVQFYTSDHQPIVRPVHADTADALRVANGR